MKKLYFQTQPSLDGKVPPFANFSPSTFYLGIENNQCGILKNSVSA